MTTDPREHEDLERLREELTSYPNVIGTAIGLRQVDGRWTDEHVLTVYVDEKRDVGDEEEIPAEIEGVRTDVRAVELSEEYGDQASGSIREEHTRPLVGGIQIAPEASISGSIAFGVEDSDGNPAFLTNNHVLHGSSDCGSTITDIEGDPIYQPSSGTASNQVGTVTAASDETGDTDDWGIVTLDDPADFSNEVLGLGKVGSPRQPNLGEWAVTSGKRHGLMSARIVSLDATVTLRDCTYTGIIECEKIEGYDTSGHSGAAIGTYDVESDTWHPIGLHFAASGDNSSIFAGPIDGVQSDSGFSYDQGDYDLNPPSGGEPYFEAIIVNVDSSAREATVKVANTGDGSGRARVTVTAGRGETVLMRQTVDLGPWEHESYTFSLDGNYDVVSINSDQRWTRNLEVGVNSTVSDWTRLDDLTEPDTETRDCAVAPDGSLLAVAATGGGTDVYIYETETWGLTATLDARADGNDTRALCWSPDGTKLVSIGDGTPAYVYRTSDWTVQQELTEPTDGCGAGCWQETAYTDYLVLGSDDGVAYNYSTSSWSVQNQYDGGTDPVAAISPANGNNIVSIGVGTDVVFYSVSGATVEGTYNTGTATVRTLATTPDDDQVIVGLNSGRLLSIRRDTATEISQSYNASDAGSMAMDPNGFYVAYQLRNGDLQINMVEDLADYGSGPIESVASSGAGGLGLAWVGDTLVAGTDGQGVYRIDAPLEVTDHPPESPENFEATYQ